jgi:hypothetical protein
MIANRSIDLPNDRKRIQALGQTEQLYEAKEQNRKESWWGKE